MTVANNNRQDFFRIMDQRRGDHLKVKNLQDGSYFIMPAEAIVRHPTIRDGFSKVDMQLVAYIVQNG